MKEEDKEETPITEEEVTDTEQEEESAEVKLEEPLEPSEEETKEEAVEAEVAPAPAEEEEVEAPEKKEKEEEIVEERIYTIPLAKAWVRPSKKRAPRAMHMIRAFITKHMKLAMRVEEEEEKEELPKLVISKEVNEKVWDRGIQKPPRKIRVRAAKDKDGNVTVYLAEGE